MRIENNQISKQLQEVLAIQQEVTQQQNALQHVDSTASNDVNPAQNSSTATTTSAINLSYNTNVFNSTSLVERHEEEIKNLKTSLDQAHEIIQTMQLKIDMERDEGIEVEKLLREAQETIEQFNQHKSSATLPQQLQQSYSRTTNSILSLSSPASIFNRQQRTILRSTRRSSQSRKRLDIVSSSPYPQNSKSLCDELSRARSIGNFILSSPISSSSLRTNDKSIAMAKENQLQNKSLSSSKSSNKAKERNIILSRVKLPSISNHDLLSPFIPSSTTSKRSTNDDQIQLQKTISNKDYYGSLIKEPESYLYKSKRDKITIDKQNQKSPPFKLNFGNNNFNVDADFIKQDGEDNDNEFFSATAMTRTMIGNWMWKYTRKVVGSGISENRHRRFFWIHPYTQTLYWSTQEPGTYGSKCSIKSVLVESFTVLAPHEQSRPPGIYIKSPSRGIQIQCLDFTAHYAWIKSLRYLLNDADHTQHAIPTIEKSTARKTTLDRKKFSSLRQKNRSFPKLLTETPSLPNSAIRFDNEEKKLESKSFRDQQNRQPLQSSMNNSTFVDLSINQTPFLDLNNLKH